MNGKGKECEEFASLNKEKYIRFHKKKDETIKIRNFFSKEISRVII